MASAGNVLSAPLTLLVPFTASPKVWQASTSVGLEWQYSLGFHTPKLARVPTVVNCTLVPDDVPLPSPTGLLCRKL